MKNILTNCYGESIGIDFKDLLHWIEMDNNFRQSYNGSGITSPPSLLHTRPNIFESTLASLPALHRPHLSTVSVTDAVHLSTVAVTYDRHCPKRCHLLPGTTLELVSYQEVRRTFDVRVF